MFRYFYAEKPQNPHLRSQSVHPLLKPVTFIFKDGTDKDETDEVGFEMSARQAHGYFDGTDFYMETWMKWIIRDLEGKKPDERPFAFVVPNLAQQNLDGVKKQKVSVACTSQSANKIKPTQYTPDQKDQDESGDEELKLGCLAGQKNSDESGDEEPKHALYIAGQKNPDESDNEEPKFGCAVYPLVPNHPPSPIYGADADKTNDGSKHDKKRPRPDEIIVPGLVYSLYCYGVFIVTPGHKIMDIWEEMKWTCLNSLFKNPSDKLMHDNCRMIRAAVCELKNANIFCDPIYGEAVMQYITDTLSKKGECSYWGNFLFTKFFDLEKNRQQVPSTLEFDLTRFDRQRLTSDGTQPYYLNVLGVLFDHEELLSKWYGDENIQTLIKSIMKAKIDYWREKQ